MISTYEITKNPLTGDIMWKVNDLDLAIADAGKSIIQAFIEDNLHESYSLSIFDILTENTVEIECDVNQIPQIVSYVYRAEHGTPLNFIGINSLTNSYVVGMSFTKGHINFGFYTFSNGKLEKK